MSAEAMQQPEATQEAPASQIVEFSPTAAGLAELRTRLANVVHDLTTAAGMDAARKDRRECVTLRTKLEAIRQREKAPILERGRLLDEEAKRITAEILQLETPLDEAIKAREATLETERERKRQAEAARVKAIRDKIEAIRLTPLTVLGESSALIAEKVADLQSHTVTSDEFVEFVVEAAQARTDALDALGKAYDAAIAAEAAAAQLAEQQAELARERAEQDEANRKAKEKRDADEAAASAERERQDAIARQEREEADRRSREARQAEDRERERRATIRGRIDDLRGIPNDLVGSPAVSIQAWIDRVRADPPDVATFAEFFDEATQAHEAVLARLTTMHEAQAGVEAERARLAREAAELAERQREEEARALRCKLFAEREEAERRRAADEEAIRALAVNPEAALREILHVCSDQSYTPGDAIKRVSAIAQAMLDVCLTTSVTISGAGINPADFHDVQRKD